MGPHVYRPTAVAPSPHQGLGAIHVDVAPGARQILMTAAARALDDGRAEIELRDLLLALTRHESSAPLLADLGVDEHTMSEAIKRRLEPE